MTAVVLEPRVITELLTAAFLSNPGQYRIGGSSRQGSTTWIWLRTISSLNRSGSMWTRSISRRPPLVAKRRPTWLWWSLQPPARSQSCWRWGCSTHETPACCLMLPAHQRMHRRQYTRSPAHLVSDPVVPTVNAYVEPRDDSVTFAAYALPCKN